MTKMGECDLSRLSDGRIQYLHNPPKFIYIFVFSVVIILLGTLFWSAVTVKAEEIQGQGTVTTPGTVSITPLTDAKVTNIYYEDGSYVTEGRVLIQLDNSNVIGPYETYSSLYEYYKEHKLLTKSMLNALNSESNPPVNPFNPSGDEEEKTFYDLFEGYKSKYSGCKDKEERDELKRQYVQSYTSELSTFTEKEKDAENSFNQCKTKIENCEVRALGSGIVHYDGVITIGMMLSTGNAIGSISPQTEKIVEMYVSPNVRAKMDVGQECKFTINGLLQSEYGEVEGMIESISSNTIRDNNSGLYFRVTVSFDAEFLKDKNGEEVPIINGMQTNVWVVYEKSTYFQYFIDKFKK